MWMLKLDSFISAFLSLKDSTFVPAAQVLYAAIRIVQFDQILVTKESF